MTKMGYGVRGTSYEDHPIPRNSYLVQRRDPLFFVAIVMPETIAGEIREFQEYVSTHFASRAALRSPPHITLVAPFSAPEDRRKLLFEILAQHSQLFENIEIVLDGFGVFGNRVIFVEVQSNPLLEDLAVNSHRVLKLHGFRLRDERRPFHPHVTVAFKDLSEEMFAKAWAYLQPKQWHRRITADSIQLLEHLEGRWKPIGEFPI